MTLRSLEIYLKVVDTGSMQAAARELYISAPSVSLAVGELEKECGVLLFERFGRRLCITPAGEQLRDHARHVLGAFGEMERQMTTLGQGARLRVGATLTVASSVLIGLLKGLPEPRPTVTVHNTRVIEEELLRGELDVALVEGEVRDLHLTARPVVEDALVLCCAPEHPLAGAAGVTLAQVAAEPLLLREEGSGTRALLLHALESRRLQFDATWNCGSILALLDAVEAGFGVTVISRRLVPERLCAVPITDADLTRTFRLVRHRDKFLSPQLTRFMAECDALARQG